MIPLEPWQWVLAVIAALAIGISKTGIGGVAMLAVVIFAQLLPAKQSSGVVLPMLILADVVAVTLYRRHAQWSYLWKLFPWTAAGVVAGYFALGHIDDHQAKVLIGVIVLGMLGLHLWRRRHANSEEPEHAWWFAPVMGLLAGFTTLVANAAGPLMAIYLLAMRLPKLAYVGTGAVYFMLMNWFKVPFMVNLDLINGPSLWLNLWLAPAVLVGTFFGKKILTWIDQRKFENLALILAALAGVKLLFS